MATKMENLAAKIDKDLPFHRFYQHNPVFLGSLHVFGEIAIVHDAQKLRSKLANHREPCMFVSYANDHAGNMFKLLNLNTRRIWKSRDMKWIARSIVAFEEPKPMTLLNVDKDDDDENNIHTWAQAHGVHVIPDEAEDDPVAPASRIE